MCHLEEGGKVLVDAIGYHNASPKPLTAAVSMPKHLAIANNFYASFQLIHKEYFSESGVNKIMNKIKCKESVIISFL